jgi:hypothetical protein
MWHHELHLEQIEQLPVRLPANARLHTRISKAVAALRTIDPDTFGLLHPEGSSKEEVDARIKGLESELDAAIFDLFELNEAERDLVKDLCSVGLDLFYRGMGSDAFNPVVKSPGNRFGRAADLMPSSDNSNPLDGYLDAFLKMWEPQLSSVEGQFRWWTIRPDEASPMLAVVFSTETKGEPLTEPPQSTAETWQRLLERVNAASVHPFQSKRVFIDGMIRAVTEHDIIVIKRNERRLWTRTAAREDAEATLFQVIKKQQASGFAEVMGGTT